MRVQPWIVSVLSVMALSVSQNGFAQYGGLGAESYPSEAGAPYYPGGQMAPAGPGYAGGAGFVPPPPPSPPGAWDPIAAGQNGGPGSHPARLPWPHITPFENRFAETYHDEELWFFRSNNSARWYYTDVDWRHASFRRPDVTRVGSEIGPQDHLEANIGDAPFLPVDTGVFFSSFLGNFVGLPGGPITPRLGQTTSVNNVAVNEQHGESDPDVNGFVITWGFREPTEVGFDISGWYTPEVHWSYSRGYNATREEVLSRANFLIGKPLSVNHALPINDGLPDGPNNQVDGAYIVYDRFFGLDFETLGGGGDINWNFTPFWRSDWYRFNPTVGLNMMYIGETFEFNGAGAGASLTFLVPPGLEIPDTFVQIRPPYESHIQSDVQSYLFGPQVGLRFEVGGDHLKFRGHSQVGLSMLHEKLNLSSFGVGDPFAPFFDQDTIFSEEQHHTRLAPTTAHQLMVEANIFQFIPIIRNIHFLDEARFRFGYQINMAFEIQRPHRIVEYNGFPLIPAIRTDQETRWYTESWNFGVHWVY